MGVQCGRGYCDGKSAPYWLDTAGIGADVAGTPLLSGLAHWCWCLVVYRAALGFGVLSVTHPTRLETRTKESNMGASHWVAKPKGVMKVKAGSGQLICDPWLAKAQHSPALSASSVGRR